MILKREQLPILIANIFTIILFTIIFISRKNYEFLIYVGVIVFFLIVILMTNSVIEYPNNILWGLTIWALMHMSGGGIIIDGKRLYEIILIPIVDSPYYIFKYDQLVHIFGFGIATLVMYYLLKPLLKEGLRKWVSLSIIVVMAGLGVGSLNEIIEFIATVISPSTGVGGYENTALDMVSDLIGAVIAMVYIYNKEKKVLRRSVNAQISKGS